MTDHVAADVGAQRRFDLVSSTATALIVPGLNGSGARHWQTLWENERDDCRRVDLGYWDDPRPEVWVERLDGEIRSQGAPVVLVAHSLGCIASVLWSRRYFGTCGGLVRGALLVAPCDTEAEEAPAVLRRFAPLPKGPLEMRTVIVASANDPYASLARSRAMAAAWGSELVNIGAAGHINAESGLGRWGYGQTLLRLLQTRRPLTRH